MDWWLELAGKLGPLAVALAVYLANRAQNRWNNSVSIRASRMEDQKLRLSLLDRRTAVIRLLRDADTEFNRPGEVTSVMIDHLYNALEAAELVFEKSHLQEIKTTMWEAWQWQHHNRTINRRPAPSEAVRLKALDDLFAVQATMMDRLPALIDALRDASRLEALPPLAVPHRPLLSRLAAFPKKGA